MASTNPDAPAEIPPPTPSSSSQPTPQQPRPHSHFDTRLGLPFDTRLLLGALSAFATGFTLGSLSIGHAASLRFRAENAHRLPLTQPGWYLYHKSKTYHKLRAGIVEGLRKGTWLTAWGSLFFVLEESMDVFRGTWNAGRTLHEMEGVDELDIREVRREVGRCRDFWSSGMAGTVTGGVWSAWNRFPMHVAARTIMMGAVVGMGYGGVQDAIWEAKRRFVVEDERNKEESWIYKGAKNRRKVEEQQDES